MGRRSDIDWESVSRDYRIGQLSVREVADKHSIAVSAVTRKAKKEGWQRDLSKQVRAATKAKVLAKVAKEAEAELSAQIKQSAQESSQQSAQAVFSEIDLAANVNATVIMRHQTRSAALARLLDKHTAELEDATDNTMTIAEIAKAIEDDSPSAATAIGQLRSLTTRMNNLKTASEILSKVNAEERKAFNIDDEGSSVQTIDDVLDMLKKSEEA